MNAPEKKRRRWPWLLPLLTCLPCVGLFGWLPTRMNKQNRGREVKGAAVLAAIEAFKADAGSYPERLEQVLAGEPGPLSYARCEKSGDFQLSYVEAGPGFLPSDFASVWSRASQRWETHELGQLPPCE